MSRALIPTVLAIAVDGCRSRSVSPDDLYPRDCLARGAVEEAEGFPARARQSYREGCERDDDRRCCERLASRMLGRESLDDVEDILERICDRQHLDGCLRAGDLLVPVAPSRAVTFYQAACQDGYGTFQGCGHERTGVCRVRPALDPMVCRKAVDRLVVAGQDEAARLSAYAVCHAAVHTGCQVLGELMAAGRGGPKDQPGAETLFTRSCRSGDETACAKAGRLADESQCNDVPPEQRTVEMDGADIRFGPFDVDGMRYCSMACDVPGKDGGLDALLGGPLATAGIGQHARELSRCGHTGQAIRLRWTVWEGRIDDVQVEGDASTAQCVAQAIHGTKAPLIATCIAVLRLP